MSPIQECESNISLNSTINSSRDILYETFSVYQNESFKDLESERNYWRDKYETLVKENLENKVELTKMNEKCQKLMNCVQQLTHQQAELSSHNTAEKLLNLSRQFSKSDDSLNYQCLTPDPIFIEIETDFDRIQIDITDPSDAGHHSIPLS